MVGGGGCNKIKRAQGLYNANQTKNIWALIDEDIMHIVHKINSCTLLLFRDAICPRFFLLEVYRCCKSEALKVLSLITALAFFSTMKNFFLLVVKILY